MPKGNPGKPKPYMIEANRQRFTTHGMKRTRTYKAWSSMRERCLRSTHKSYPQYGGRGIKIDPQWNDFRRFLLDMGIRPDGMSLGRINNDLGYSLENCRWETVDQQQNNKQTTRWVTLRGETMPLNKWVKRLGIKRTTLSRRIDAGWSEDAIIEIEISKRNKRIKNRFDWRQDVSAD